MPGLVPVILQWKEPVLLGGMADSRIGPGNKQDDPGTLLVSESKDMLIKQKIKQTKKILHW